MTTASIQDQVDEIFADARLMHAQAVEQLERGDIRDAAEKAWCATKRATDALILAIMGEGPGPTGFTSRACAKSESGRGNEFQGFIPAGRVAAALLWHVFDPAPQHQSQDQVVDRRHHALSMT